MHSRPNFVSLITHGRRAVTALFRLLLHKFLRNKTVNGRQPGESRCGFLLLYTMENKSNRKTPNTAIVNKLNATNYDLFKSVVSIQSLSFLTIVTYKNAIINTSSGTIINAYSAVLL